MYTYTLPPSAEPPSPSLSPASSSGLINRSEISAPFSAPPLEGMAGGAVRCQMTSFRPARIFPLDPNGISSHSGGGRALLMAHLGYVRTRGNCRAPCRAYSLVVTDAA